MKTAGESDLKQVVKAALAEVLDERRDLLREALAEALEDIGMGRAIEEGLKSGPATREEVFNALKRAE
jgi:Arc/MetJ-type ribon-helix-helix transcriptional regulator